MNRRRPRLARILGPQGTAAAPAAPTPAAPRSAAPLVATTFAAALALSGCQAFSPLQTQIGYEPADGVAVDLGDIQIRDLLIISKAKGEVGTLSGMVVNNGTKPVTITFATGAAASAAGSGSTPGASGSSRAEVPGGTQTRLSGVDGTAAVTLPAIDAAPGDIIRVTVSTARSGASEVSVPVLGPEGYYATITPPPPTAGVSNL